MRAGPGLGNIGPEQADYFQIVKGGGHGSYRNIVLAPSSVQEMCDLTVLAFDLADQYRNPAIVLADGFVGQMMVVIISHWIHGHQVSAEFTPIEHRLMEDMLILKLRELRDAAELTPDTDPNVTAIHQD